MSINNSATLVQFLALTHSKLVPIHVLHNALYISPPTALFSSTTYTCCDLHRAHPTSSTITHRHTLLDPLSAFAPELSLPIAPPASQHPGDVRNKDLLYSSPSPFDVFSSRISYLTSRISHQPHPSPSSSSSPSLLASQSLNLPNSRTSNLPSVKV
ncbi:unnamed protein product [Cutaneotrichosporon oleaginosum]